MSHSRRYSDIWKHFTADYYEDHRASCNVCKRDMSFKSTITNLYTHLRRHHPEIVVKASGKNIKMSSVEMIDMENFEVTDKQEEDDPVKNKRNTYSDDDSEHIEESTRKLNRFRKKRMPIKVDPDDAEKFVAFMLQNSSNESERLAKFNRTLRPSSHSKVSDCDAFAVRLSTCLQDLRSEQRFIAEKLISDVLFYGRFGKLSENSQVTMLVEKDALSEVNIMNTNETIAEEQEPLKFEFVQNVAKKK